MNKTTKLAPLLLIYGFFAVLCQTVFLLLSLLSNDLESSLFLLRHTYIPWLESSVASLTLTISGAFLFAYLFGVDKE